MKMFYMHLADRLAQKGLDRRRALIQAFRLFCVLSSLRPALPSILFASPIAFHIFVCTSDEYWDAWMQPSIVLVWTEHVKKFANK